MWQSVLLSNVRTFSLPSLLWLGLGATAFIQGMLPACSCVCDRSDKRRKETKKSEFDKEKTNRRAISTVNGSLVADKLCFLSLEVESCDIVHVTADEAKGLFTCNRPCTNRKCQAALNHARIQWLTLTALAHKYRNSAQGRARKAR